MTELPEGVILRTLTRHEDARGSLYELYRQEWTPVPPFLQFNVAVSRFNSLRGVHVHPRHADYLHVLTGEMRLGLHDLRPADPKARTTLFVTLRGDTPQIIFVPPGVCHGFWFPVETTYIYGLSTGWSMNEELGCRYDDPALGLDWGVTDPLLSPRDTAPATGYAAMRAAWLASQT
jgi:dTDP-4-dehydrorhamnose 3,5-epimerase